jgi:hypothetical protein
MIDNQTIVHDEITLDKLQIVQLENPILAVQVSPQTGGRITSIFHKSLRREFLWKNERLSLAPAPVGEPYDPNFYGGIDEVIPCDLPETIDALPCPDHGELWTLPLNYQVEDAALMLHGKLPRWGLFYQKRVSLRPDAPWIDIDYRIENQSGDRRVFLWKLHAATVIAPGDRLVCPARMAVSADPRWSRWQDQSPFAWPVIQGQDAGRIPPADGTTDFLFLYDLSAGQVSLQHPADGSELRFTYDLRVFPYMCYFASYGGFDGHYTAVLEPSTAMPVSVNEAMALNQCSFLEAGNFLATRISIYAGPLRSSLDIDSSDQS